MCLSNSTTCAESAWVPYATSVAWTLSSGDGLKNVYTWFRDIYGNTDLLGGDSVQLDATKPKNGGVTGQVQAGELLLKWADYTDASSGVNGYTIVYASGSTAPASCAAGTVLATTDAYTTTVEHVDAVSGATYSYRVCAVDKAGNVSTGATVTVTAM